MYIIRNFSELASYMGAGMLINAEVREDMIVDSKDRSNKQRVILITFPDGGDFTLQVNGEFKNVEPGVTYSCNSDTNSDFSIMEFM